MPRTKKAEKTEAPRHTTDRAQMYADYLRNEGYRPQIDEQGDVVFKREGRTYVMMASESEKDDEFFRLVFPNFWSIENDGERAKVEKSALYATAATKVAKVFPVGDNVHATIELFCSPPEGIKAVFPRSMHALRTAVETFADKMRE